MGKYSIIVPIYNPGEKLIKCITSIKEQTYYDFEAILVDDCSTDNSLNYCQIISKHDRRFKIVQHEINSGQSVARNTGLNYASGEFILFVDSDDYLETNLLEYLDKNIVNSEIDLITWGMYYDRISNDGKVNIIVSSLNYPEKKNIILPDSYMMRELLMNTFFASPCNKLYRREIIDKYKIRFDKYCPEFEDFIFNLEYVKNIKSFFIDDKPFYHYIQPVGQISSLKRKWATVVPYQVSAKVMNSCQDFIRRRPDEFINVKCDIFLYAFQAFNNETEYGFRTRNFKEFIKFIEPLIWQSEYFCMIKNLKGIISYKFFIPVYLCLKIHSRFLLACLLCLIIKLKIKRIECNI